MPEQETAECWVVQYRVKGRSQEWGKWAAFQDYRTETAALRMVDWKRQRDSKDPITRAEMEWRVLKVTQEVVY